MTQKRLGINSNGQTGVEKQRFFLYHKNPQNSFYKHFFATGPAAATASQLPQLAGGSAGFDSGFADRDADLRQVHGMLKILKHISS